MKDFITTFFLLSTFTIFMYAAVMQGTVYGQDNSTLKFSTEKVRAMWYMCSTQFQMVAPHIGQAERVRLCDCYVDHMRSTFTPEQVEALTAEQSRELGMKMNIICPTQAQSFNLEAT
jgi:hypothetical protein